MLTFKPLNGILQRQVQRLSSALWAGNIILLYSKVQLPRGSWQPVKHSAALALQAL